MAPDPGTLPADIEVRIEEFCGLVATAISNVAAHAAQAASRERILVATDEARRRGHRDRRQPAAYGVRSRSISRTSSAGRPAAAA